MAKQRLQQVADTMQRILGEVIQTELKDPRVGFASVTNVEVSADLQHAKVYISIMGTPEERATTMAALQRARGFLRKRVAEEMRHMRFIPELHLIEDTSIDYSLHINDVIRQIQHERMVNPPRIDDEQ
ncbi:MAG: 30S ribosome-binding factor RbfA [Chloroflexus aggregans]|uniref:Ribosome-binding factor A n=1 Tax=Chloroflexus aggregans TaxID=152260 RepID=A0A2J6X1F9_9CHLR|nr:MAG: 30S ribosome-binding factor RbfA [Chloroflexus aggregans]